MGLPNGNGMMLVFNQKTGQPIAILQDEAYLTDVRTAVAGAICAKYISTEKSKWDRYCWDRRPGQNAVGIS